MQRKWEEYYKSHNYFHLEPHEYLNALVSKCSQLDFDKVLDLGCGAGTDILYLAERGFDVTGVDFSPSAASNAEDLLQSKGLGGKVFVDNLFDKITTFGDSEFQVIMGINALEYTDLDTFKSTLGQIADTLVPNGLFLLVVSSEDTKIGVEGEEDQERIFFTEEEISNIVGKQFKILDFSKDKNKSFVLLLQKNATD